MIHRDTYIRDDAGGLCARLFLWLVAACLAFHSSVASAEWTGPASSAADGMATGFSAREQTCLVSFHARDISLSAPEKRLHAAKQKQSSSGEPVADLHATKILDPRPHGPATRDVCEGLLRSGHRLAFAARAPPSAS